MRLRPNTHFTGRSGSIQSAFGRHWRRAREFSRSMGSDRNGPMRTSIGIALFACLVAGCAQLPKNHRVASFSFRSDPLDHPAEEAIKQIEIIVPSAKVHRLGKMPTDWFAGVGGGQNGPAECTLNCAHQSFAEPNIHAFDGLVRFVVPESPARPEAKVRLWTTRGPLGEGRVIDLSTNDFTLK